MRWITVLLTLILVANNVCGAEEDSREIEIQRLRAENAVLRKTIHRLGRELEEARTEITRLRKAKAEDAPAEAKTEKAMPEKAMTVKPKEQVSLPTAIKIDDRWIMLPKFDMSRPSSQTKPFTPEKRYYYRQRNGVIVTALDRSLWPPGAVDITRQHNAKRRKQWEDTMPRFAVGEFGKILGYEIVQIIGDEDMIVEIGLADPGWTCIGVPNCFELVRLCGFSTKGLTDGKRATLDDPIAIIDTWRYSTRTIFLAVPLERIKCPLSDEEAVELKMWLHAKARTK